MLEWSLNSLGKKAFGNEFLQTAPWRPLICGFVFAMVLQHQFWGRDSHFLVRWRARGAAGCLYCFYTAAARIGFMSGSNEINLTVCFLRPSPLIKLAGYSRNT